jgi:hypothetical protein
MPDVTDFDLAFKGLAKANWLAIDYRNDQCRRPGWLWSGQAST